MESDAFPRDGDGGRITPSIPHQAVRYTLHVQITPMAEIERSERSKSGTAVMAARRDEPDEPAETSQNHEEMVHF